jgi:ribosomal protein L11 methyltransferase
MNTYQLFEIKCETDTAEILIAELSAIGFEGFLENDEGFEAYILSEDLNRNLMNEVCEQYGISANHIQEKEVQNQNWNAAWEQNFQPVIIKNTIRISAPFHELANEYPIELLIQPKTSFGTGHHETTASIMELLLSEDVKDKNVFDFGTGTGILSILAKVLGAKEIFANDIDDWAAENIHENLDLNKMDGIDFKKGGLEVLNSAQVFDLILANINKNVLMQSFEKLSSHSHNKSKLYISGFLEKDLPDLKHQAEKAGWLLSNKVVNGEWCAASFLVA